MLTAKHSNDIWPNGGQYLVEIFLSETKNTEAGITNYKHTPKTKCKEK
jgi:hypothetical protein